MFYIKMLLFCLFLGGCCFLKEFQSMCKLCYVISLGYHLCWCCCTILMLWCYVKQWISSIITVFSLWVMLIFMTLFYTVCIYIFSYDLLYACCIYDFVCFIYVFFYFIIRFGFVSTSTNIAIRYKYVLLNYFTYIFLNI